LVSLLHSELVTIPVAISVAITRTFICLHVIQQDANIGDLFALVKFIYANKSILVRVIGSYNVKVSVRVFHQDNILRHISNWWAI
jgi:hypothetical protein